MKLWPLFMLAVAIGLFVQLARMIAWDFRSTDAKRDIIRRQERRRLRRAARR